MRFDLFESVMAKGQLCSNELLLSKTYDKSLIPLYRKIAECTDKDEQQRLKKQLPGITWQAHFPGGRRVNAEAEPSGLYMVDVDGIDNPAQVYNDRVAAHLTDCDILAVHITPSRRGLRIVAVCRPEFSTIEENQSWLAGQLGVEIDAACKDLARFSYLVPNEYFLYWDGSIWTRDPKCLVNSLTPSPSPKGEGSEKSLPSGGDLEEAAQDSYKGIPLKDIASKWLELNGGEPQQGERNTVLFELATRMRYICEFNADIIAKAIPHCGLSKAEVEALCKSACTTQRSTKMPSDLRMVLKNLSLPPTPSNSGGVEVLPMGEDLGGAFDDPHDEEFLARLPKLPIGLKESLVGVPDKVKMPIIAALMPLAMSYATDVEVQYCDGKRHRLNCMAIIFGRQASGKSSVKDVIDIWKGPMKEADSRARAAEDEFKKLRKNRKANEKLPEEPHAPIIEVPITISCSTLLKRMKNALGKHLFSFGEELDTLRKTNGAGSWSSKYDVYRLSFDNGEWGQDYNSDQAESGVVDVAYNWTVLGTRGAVLKCFKNDNVENGMSGRVLFAKMPSRKYEHMPSYGQQAAKDEEAIRRAVYILSNCHGFVDTPKLRKVVQDWCDARADEASRIQDDVLDTFRKRAAVIGFRCGVVFHLLQTGAMSVIPGAAKESRSCTDFAIVMAEYALKYQCELFGSQLLEANTTISDTGYKTRNKSLFDELPAEFSFDEVRAARPDTRDNTLRVMIYTWKREGRILPIAPNQWKKI